MMNSTDVINNNDSSRMKKTRYRVPTVCAVCRRRKMKCDKKKPHCSSCVKNNTVHLCHYDEQPWEKNSEIQKLKDQIFNLQKQNNELKTLLNRSNAKVLSTSNSIKSSNDNFNLIIPDQTSNDAVLELAENFDLLMLKENKMAHFGSTSYMAVLSNDPILKPMMKPILDAQKLGINFQKFFLYDQGIAPIQDTCSVLAPDYKIGIFESDFTSNHYDLVQKINDILPSKEIVMALIDHFFAQTYVFVPFIEQKSFRQNMESLISENSDGKACLVVNSIPLLVSVATFLSVLRFSYISLPNKQENQSSSTVSEFNSSSNNHDGSKNNEAMKKILKSGVSIPPTYIEYAKACISNANALRKPTLKHIQSLLLLRVYRYYAPEDGDESTDSTIFLALIVQMAKMHGLHRDPSRFSVVTDYDTAQVWRKIWVQLMYFDAAQALTFGCPLLIDDEYDTQLPKISSSDCALERKCIESLVKMHEVSILIRNIVRSCSKIREFPKRSTIENDLKTIEYTILKYRTFDELSYLNDPNESFVSKFSKARDLTLKIHLYQVHAVCYYILMLTCDKEESDAIQKYKNGSAESCLIVFRMLSLYALSPSLFNSQLGFEPFISAAAFETAKRVLPIVSQLIVKDLLGLFDLSKIITSFTMPDSVGLREWICMLPNLSIGENLFLRYGQFIQSCTRLSNRYFVCWRVTFIDKIFEDYVELLLPGKFEELQKKISEHNKNINDNSEYIDIDLFGIRDQTSNANNADENFNEIWTQLVDSTKQSKFDYLTANFEKFDGIGDPYFNKDNFGYGPGIASEFSFQDFNTFSNATGMSISSQPTMEYPTNSSSGSSIGNITNASFQRDSFSTDEISPKTDSSNDIPINESGILNTGNDAGKMGLTDHDLAMQVAKSMFSGSNDLYLN